MNVSPLVVFSGIDGAGKSTQIRILADRLAAEGKRTCVLWGRIGYTPGVHTVRKLIRVLSGTTILPPPGHSPARDRTMARPWVRRWWLRLGMIDLLFYWGVWLRVCQGSGYLVICDRYWLDSELDLRLNFPEENAHQWWLWRLVVGSCPKPNAAFLMTAPWEVCRHRSTQKQEPFPLSIFEFEQRLQQYERIESVDPWVVLDGQRPEAELAHAIESSIVRCNGSLSGSLT